MGHGYVLTEECGGRGRIGWESVRAVVPKSGEVTELTAGLRPWALDVVARERLGDGRYCAYLVELAADGTFDTYLALSFEDIIWFYEQEYVPATCQS